MRWIFKKLLGRSDLDEFTFVHDYDLVGKRQGLHLIMRHINQGQLQLFVDLLEFAPEVPLQMGIDHRQRFVE